MCIQCDIEAANRQAIMDLQRKQAEEAQRQAARVSHPSLILGGAVGYNHPPRREERLKQTKARWVETSGALASAEAACAAAARGAVEPDGRVNVEALATVFRVYEVARATYTAANAAYEAAQKEQP